MRLVSVLYKHVTYLMKCLTLHPTKVKQELFGFNISFILIMEICPDLTAQAQAYINYDGVVCSGEI